jgi:SSS family solute:Na+ symporter
MQVTGAIFLGGAGSVIIGGLYWKKGSTAAAYSAMIVGSILAISGLVLDNLWMNWYGKNFYLNGQWMWFLSMISAIAVYITVSLLGRQPAADMDRILHHGKYAIKDDIVEIKAKQATRLVEKIKWCAEQLGVTDEFTRGDKIIYGSTLLWTILWLGIIIFGTVYNCVNEASDESWAKFWHFFVWMGFAMAFITAIWFTIGGLSNVKDAFKILNTVKRNDHDDGTITATQDSSERKIKIEVTGIAQTQNILKDKGTHVATD